jgi:hypothetical protein
MRVESTWAYVYTVRLLALTMKTRRSPTRGQGNCVPFRASRSEEIAKIRLSWNEVCA